MSARLSRRDLLKAGGALAASSAGMQVGLPRAHAQTPKRGGTISLRLWDPPHFDLHQTISYKTNILHTFTHSRLLKYKAGPGVQPGSFILEGDLAESWTQPAETTYVFKLRKGVRWHAKPPVNGREFTADDVKYTFDRFVNEKGNAYRSMMAALEKVEVVDKYTVKMTLKEPYVWFLDMVANPMALAIIPKEAVEKFGDLKKPEAMVGTGPWMLDSYRPNVGLTFVRNPAYFLAGLPYIDKVEVTVDEDNASRMAAFIAGKYDLGWEASGTINRVDWVQIKDTLKQRRPKIQSLEFASNQMSHIYMRTDRPPFNDVRVRRAISLAFDRQGLLDAVAEGVGVLNPAVPLALKDWALPVDQLGEGAQFYKFDPARASSRRRAMPTASPLRCPMPPTARLSRSTPCSSSSSTSKTSASTPSPSSRNTAHTSAPPSTASTSPWPLAPRRLSSIPTTTSSDPTWRASSRIRATSTIPCSATC